MAKTAPRPAEVLPPKKPTVQTAEVLDEFEWTLPPPKPPRFVPRRTSTWMPGVIARLRSQPHRMGAFLKCFSAGQAHNRKKSLLTHLGDEASDFEFEIREVEKGSVWKLWGRYNPPTA